MKNFSIFARDKEDARKIKETALRLGLAIGKPDFIISVGGDGTFLRAERRHPGIPKLLIKDSNVCNKCDNLEYDGLFQSILNDEYEIEEHLKLKGYVNGSKHIAVNDFSVRNRLPIHAIRFSVTINKKQIYPLIGDGIVIASSFDSTGYYKSITKKSFSKGIGLAFNNVTENIRHRVLDKGAVVRVKLLRHDADLTVDNDQNIITLKEGQELTVCSSKQKARVIHVRQRKWSLPFSLGRRK
jgi:NAD+ kinase